MIIVDCVWDNFGPWTPCSNEQSPCQETGEKTRVRKPKIDELYGGKPCEGDVKERKECDALCPGISMK